MLNDDKIKKRYLMWDLTVLSMMGYSYSWEAFSCWNSLSYVFLEERRLPRYGIPQRHPDAPPERVDRGMRERGKESLGIVQRREGAHRSAPPPCCLRSSSLGDVLEAFFTASWNRMSFSSKEPGGRVGEGGPTATRTPSGWDSGGINAYQG